MAHRISRELLYLATMRQARVVFFEGIEAHAAAHVGLGVGEIDREHRKLLRSDGLFQVAEFFYMLDAGGVTEPEAIGGFLERHNADMQALLATCERGYAAGGLSAARIKKAIFTPSQIAYVKHESASGKPRFDQQSLQRIFVQSMSFESCRLLLVLLSDFGFLNRWEYNQVIIESRGVLEDLYAAQLRTITAAL